MTERFAATARTTVTLLRGAGTRAQRDAGRLWAWWKRWSPRAAAVIKAAALHTLAFIKRVTLRVLLAAETVLLSPVGRERAQATAVFALIFAFAVTSVDCLITGGPEFYSRTPSVALAEGVELAAAASPSAAPAIAPTPVSATIIPVSLDDHVDGLDASALLGDPDQARATTARRERRSGEPVFERIAERRAARAPIAAALTREKTKPARS